MYALLALVAAAVYLLLAGPREKLEPTSTILAPNPDMMQLPYNASEIARIKEMVPDYLKSDPDSADGVEAAFFISMFYKDVYKPATAEITQTQIDNYVKQKMGSDYPYSTYGRPNALGARYILTRYFIGAAAANALPLPANMGTLARRSDNTETGNPVREAIEASERAAAGGTGGTGTTGNTAGGGVTNNAAPTPPNMEALETRYKEKYDLYTQYAGEAIATQSATNREMLIGKIKGINTELAAILADMISAIATSGNTAKSTEKLRDELVSRLQRIQFDYNGLLVSTDKLTTLRRIRQFETAKSTEKVNSYLIGLAVLSGLLVIAVILKS